MYQPSYRLLQASLREVTRRLAAVAAQLATDEDAAADAAAEAACTQRRAEQAERTAMANEEAAAARREAAASGAAQRAHAAALEGHRGGVARLSAEKRRLVAEVGAQEAVAAGAGAGASAGVVAGVDLQNRLPITGSPPAAPRCAGEREQKGVRDCRSGTRCGQLPIDFLLVKKVTCIGMY